MTIIFDSTICGKVVIFNLGEIVIYFLNVKLTNDTQVTYKHKEWHHINWLVADVGCRRKLW
jgi:hypothetical protein